MRHLLSFVFFIAISISLQAQSFSNGFNFYLPPGDSTEQEYLPYFPAEPITNFINVGSSGHFESNENPIRFWGVNLTAGACFPYKEKAAFVAARMRKMGINLVRFHHMDNPWTNNEGTIFDRNLNNTRSLNTVTLDRLHFFLHHLKRNGIYANINLHVSRTFKEGDGVSGANSIPEFGKTVTMFDPQLIELQKEYASQLLTSVNPYTGLSLVNDPVMGMVEITNENTIYGFWRGDQLRRLSEGGNLPERHAQFLDDKWNQFLQSKYVSQSALATAWNTGAVSGGQNEQMRDQGFESGNINDEWILELHDNAQASISVDANNTNSGNFAGRVSITNTTGTDWHIQFKQSGLSVENGQAYSIRFFARADRSNRPLTISVMRDNSPWTWYSGTTFQLDINWQEYFFTFTAPEDNASNVRVSFSFGNEAGTVWFDDFSMADPERRGLETGESFTSNNIKRILYSLRNNYTSVRVQDMAEFYLDLQTQYYNEMYRYLKEELGVKVPITGSNALGGLGEVMSMSELDYVDDHAYWDHPWFPNTPWDSYDWLQRNEAMLSQDQLQTITDVFSGLAIAGKPYTVSEYNHPFPNRYQTEMIPILTAYASFHDADGLMFYDYNGGQPWDWEEDIVDNFFSIHRNNVLMALSPIYAFAYRQNLLQPATQAYTFNYPPEYIYGLTKNDNNGRWGKYLPYDANIAMSHAVQTSGFDGTTAPDLSVLPTTFASVFTTSTGETTVNFDQDVIYSHSPNFVSLAGAFNQASGQSVGDLTLKEGNDFGVLAWLSLDNQPLSQARKSIIALSSKLQNKGMQWDGTQTIHNNYGSSPTEIFPLQVKLELNIAAESIRVYPLSVIGAADQSQTYLPIRPGVFEITLDQSQSQSLWFGIEALSTTVNTTEISLSSINLRVFPNPSTGNTVVRYQLPRQESVIMELFNATGQKVKRFFDAVKPTGNHQEVLNLENLSAGIYYLRVQIASKVFNQKIEVIR